MVALVHHTYCQCSRHVSLNKSKLDTLTMQQVHTRFASEELDMPSASLKARRRGARKPRLLGLHRFGVVRMTYKDI